MSGDSEIIMNEDLIKMFDTIRFSNEVLCDDCYNFCDENRFDCDDTTSCSLENNRTGSDSSLSGDNNTINSDPSLKDQYSPEEISYWINFGHFRDKNSE